MNRIQTAKRFAHKNSVVILGATGISGVAVTSYLTGSAGYKQGRIDTLREEHGEDPLERKDRIRELVGFYAPGVVSGVLTVSAMTGSIILSKREAGVLAAAYATTSVAFEEYRKKVVEKLGDARTSALEADLAQDKVATVSPPNNLTILSATDVLTFEVLTGRYFMCTAEKLKQAQNEINSKVFNDLYATLDDFYDIIGLGKTGLSTDLGWDSDRLLEIKLSTVLTEDNRPCLAFDYNYTKKV